MHDEYGALHGFIKTNNNNFKNTDDYVVTATLYDVDGTGIFGEQGFLYIEKAGDLEYCEATGLIAVGVQADLSPAEAVSGAAQEWLTENYRTYIHTHDTPQEVYIIGGS